MNEEKKVYVSDHSESVLRSHSWRTAANSAAYLLDSIKPTMRILDVGCGPGTISTDLASLVPQGEVVAIDSGQEAIDKAKTLASERGLTNLHFRVGDANKLDFAAESFDVVHSHQVLQHLSDPVHALQEWRRVTKTGGIVASRVADMAAASYYPDMLGDFHNLFLRVSRAYGGFPDGGRRVIAWAMESGFPRHAIKPSSSVWCYSDPEARAWWSSLWADRLTKSSLRKNAVDGGFATEEDLERLARLWHEWGTCDDGFYALLHGEILCTNVPVE